MRRTKGHVDEPLIIAAMFLALIVTKPHALWIVVVGMVGVVVWTWIGLQRWAKR